MPHAGNGELLSSGVFKLDRPARLEGQHGSERLGHHLLLVSKATADAGLDDVNVADRNIEREGHHPAAVIWDLGTGAEDQPTILVQPGDGDVRLQTGMLLVLDKV